MTREEYIKILLNVKKDLEQLVKIGKYEPMAHNCLEDINLILEKLNEN